MIDPPIHFFKFIPPGFKFDLSIPSSFLTNLNPGSCSNVKLRRGCHEWSVDIDDGVFGEGWRGFVRENGVQEFDFIVFKHQGSMVFDFLVFDQSTCERQYPNEMDVEPIPTNRLKKLKKRKRKEDAASQEQEEFQIEKGSDSTMDQKNCNSTSKCHRYFISILKPSNFKRAALHLPINFSAPNDLKMGEMILRDDKGRSWEVQLNKREEKFVYLGRGIKPFLVANGFKEGDAFKFELVGKKKGKPPIANFSCIHGLIPFEEDDRQYSIGELKSYNIQQSDLYIPVRFSMSNGLKVGEMILRDDKDRSWKVQVNKKDEKHVYIGRGLRAFRVANGLKKGDACRFELVENEKDKPPIVSFSLLKSKQIKPDKKAKSEENEDLIPCEEDGHPYFKGELKSYSIRRSHLYLPLRFARSDGLINKKQMILKNVKDGRSWAVKIQNHKNKFYYIGEGWKDFCVANGLKEGDHFKFELADKGKNPIVNFYFQKNPLKLAKFS